MDNCQEWIMKDMGLAYTEEHDKHHHVSSNLSDVKHTILKREHCLNMGSVLTGIQKPERYHNIQLRLEASF